MIRARRLTEQDLPVLFDIHQKYYETEFGFPDFLKRFHAAFIVEESNRVITAGGIRPIAESIIITDQSIPIDVRREALLEMLRGNIYAGQRCDYNELHCFIQDDAWYRHLQKAGFRPTVGKSLVMEI